MNNCKHENYEIWESRNIDNEKSSVVHFCLDCGAKFKILSHTGAFHSNPLRTWKKIKELANGKPRR